jgi:polyhydroxyalkanoate synthesis regulator protein
MDIFKCHGCKYKFLLKKKEKRGIAQLLSFYERQLQTILQEYSERMFLFHKSFDQQVLNDCLSSGTVQNPEGPFGSKPSQLPQDLRRNQALMPTHIDHVSKASPRQLQGQHICQANSLLLEAPYWH